MTTTNIINIADHYSQLMQCRACTGTAFEFRRSWEGAMYLQCLGCDQQIGDFAFVQPPELPEAPDCEILSLKRDQ